MMLFDNVMRFIPMYLFSVSLLKLNHEPYFSNIYWGFEAFRWCMIVVLLITIALLTKVSPKQWREQDIPEPSLMSRLFRYVYPLEFLAFIIIFGDASMAFAYGVSLVLSIIFMEISRKLKKEAPDGQQD